ncbi:MAG: cytidylyltransferase domain-containing protein, partial [Promethearchaeota archaeon]
KHLLPFCGKPLIEWTFARALEFYQMPEPLFSDLALSTDSRKLYDLCPFYSVIRPPVLAMDDTPKLDVLRNILNIAEEELNTKYDCIIDLDATNPCRTVEDIENCFNIFKDKKPKTVISVVKAKKNPYFNQITIDPYNNSQFDIFYRAMVKDYSINGDFDCKPVSRQECPEVFDVNANIYVYNAEWLRDEKNLSPITDNTEIYIMPNWTRHDIDDEYDFFDCENNFRKYILNK